MTVPTGLAYGEGKALADAQRALPVADQQSPGRVTAIYDAARSYSAPSIGLGRPSDRPDEPITAGIDMGAGPGSDSLDLSAYPTPGASTTDPDLAEAVRFLPTLEMVASLPGSTVSFRNYVRRIRGAAGDLDGPA